MSRASNVRDAVLAAIQTELPSETAETFVVPNYTNEELQSGARIIVRNGGRQIAIGQGVDTRDVLVEVGVVGVVGPKQGGSGTEYKTEELTKADQFDALMESVIALWTKDDDGDGPLRRCGMAGHSFESMEQVIQMDAEKLYSEGIWLSVIQLTYRDSED